MLNAKEEKRLNVLDRKIMGGRKVTRKEVLEAFDLQRKKAHKG